MTLLAFCIGAFLFGWLLPELVFLHSARPHGVATTFNVISGVCFTLIAYGIKG
jgi:hypothetical protein